MGSRARYPKLLLLTLFVIGYISNDLIAAHFWSMAKICSSKLYFIPAHKNKLHFYPHPGLA
jgi:hypothetical protein